MPRGRLRFSAPRNQRSGARPNLVFTARPQSVKTVERNKKLVMKLDVIEFPIGSCWGLQRCDGKILMKETGKRDYNYTPLMDVFTCTSYENAEKQRYILDPLTTEERQKLGFF